jgi:hypothetical protein
MENVYSPFPNTNKHTHVDTGWVAVQSPLMEINCGRLGALLKGTKAGDGTMTNSPAAASSVAFPCLCCPARGLNQQPSSCWSASPASVSQSWSWETKGVQNLIFVSTLHSWFEWPTYQALFWIRCVVLRQNQKCAPLWVPRTRIRKHC